MTNMFAVDIQSKPMIIKPVESQSILKKWIFASLRNDVGLEANQTMQIGAKKREKNGFLGQLHSGHL